MLGGSLGGSMVDPTAFKNYLLSLSPLSMWALDETSGTTATDQGSLANNGTYTNSPTLGQNSLLPLGDGRSVYFSGAATPPHVQIATNAGYSTATFTIICIVQLTAAEANAPVVNWRDSGNNDGWTLQQPASGTGFTFFVHDGTGFKTAAQGGLSTGVPYLLIGRCTGSAVKLALTNLATGVTAAEASNACGNLNDPDSSPNVRIAREANVGTGADLNGYVQLVTWIGSSISDAQVADLQRLAIQ